MNIIVVGAGIAGLSTAWSLVKAGYNVTLLEQGATIPNPSRRRSRRQWRYRRTEALAARRSHLNRRRALSGVPGPR